MRKDARTKKNLRNYAIIYLRIVESILAQGTVGFLNRYKNRSMLRLS